MSITVRDKVKIEQSLESALKLAKSPKAFGFTRKAMGYLDHLFTNIDTATSGYLNVLTCLTCSSLDKKIDPRFHRTPGKGMSAPKDPDGWFSGRTVSEKVIYPWLYERGLRTAKSGWQTRTYERPKPYTLDYPENIAIIKDSFLGILDVAFRKHSLRIEMVAYLLRKDLEHCAKLTKLKKQVSKSRVGNEVLIVDVLDCLHTHFSKANTAHLPVVAIYSIYQLLIEQVAQYHAVKLSPLESHQASDLRTGAVGDIELVDSDGDVVEGIEVKHGMPIDLPIVITAEEKILKSKLKRYYILTTHDVCNPVDLRIHRVIRNVYREHGCQIIPNGVYPTIRYYLRMMKDPSQFLDTYSRNLANQEDVTTAQVEHWLEILDGLKLPK